MPLLPERMGVRKALAVTVAFFSCLVVPGSGQVPAIVPCLYSAHVKPCSSQQRNVMLSCPMSPARSGRGGEPPAVCDGNFWAVPCCISSRCRTSILNPWRVSSAIILFSINDDAGRCCRHQLLLSRARLFSRVVPQVSPEPFPCIPTASHPDTPGPCSSSLVSCCTAVVSQTVFLPNPVLQGRLLRRRQDGMRIKFDALRRHRPLHLRGQDRGNFPAGR